MYSQILVPLDGSPLAEKALAHAEGLAKTSQATVHLLRVFTRHPEGPNPTGGSGLETNSSIEHSIAIARNLEEALIGEAQEYLEHITIRLQNDGLGAL